MLLRGFVRACTCAMAVSEAPAALASSIACFSLSGSVVWKGSGMVKLARLSFMSAALVLAASAACAAAASLAAFFSCSMQVGGER